MTVCEMEMKACEEETTDCGLETEACEEEMNACGQEFDAFSHVFMSARIGSTISCFAR